jgi:fumarate reductase flavoprotein subunit
MQDGLDTKLDALLRGTGTWDLQTGVIVVGAGIAGHCAALAAAEHGAEVLLLEKQGEIGGSTVLSSGFFAFAGTDAQRRCAIDDSGGKLLRELREIGGFENDETLLRTYADQQLDAYAWLQSNGVVFGKVELSSGQSIARSHSTDPRQVIQALSRQSQASGHITLLPRTRAQRLVRANAQAPIAGILATRGEDGIAIQAHGGTVLAAGGFSRSEELLKTFAPAQARALRIGGEGNTGDGIRMAWQLGAGLRDMGYIKGTFGSHPKADHLQHRTQSILPVYRGAIAVNRAGRRFVDESLSYKLLGDACLQQQDAIAWQVFDQQVMAQSSPGAALFDFAPALQQGLLMQADTLAALADRAGIAREPLLATVERYNGYVDTGRDAEFGRDGLSSHSGRLTKIDRPPFYAFPSTSVVLATYCGVTVDAGARVLDVFGGPLEGLFAAGEMTGGFHGVAYMTGTSLGKAVVFGRIAGEQAARRCSQARHP